MIITAINMPLDVEFQKIELYDMVWSNADQLYKNTLLNSRQFKPTVCKRYSKVIKQAQKHAQ